MLALRCFILAVGHICLIHLLTEGIRGIRPHPVLQHVKHTVEVGPAHEASLFDACILGEVLKNIQHLFSDFEFLDLGWCRPLCVSNLIA